MSVGAVSATNYVQQYQSAQTGTQRIQAQAQGQRPEGPPDGGAFIDAIASALQSIGATSSGSDSGASQSDAAQALGQFLHSLGAALRSQGGGAPPPAGQGPQGAGGPPPQGGQGPQGAGGPPPGGGLQKDLQSLIQSLSSSSSDSATSDSTTSDLQSSFQQLLGALGIQTNDGTGLRDFLQALSSNLSGTSSSGNVVNTSA